MPNHSPYLKPISQWFNTLGFEAAQFQKEAWEAYWCGKNGLINAPTGSGKTYAALLGALSKAKVDNITSKGLQLIWLTPIRALAKEIAQSAERAIAGLELNWKVGIRHGDTKSSEKQSQRKQMPEILVTTPETLHLLFTQNRHQAVFENLKCIVVDEWHELLGSKRSVQIELAIAYLSSLNPKLQTWGISATIGNLEQAMHILRPSDPGVLIKARLKKKINVESLLPQSIDKFPWGGHLGITLLKPVIDIVNQSVSTLIFTNTRAQAEIWYQRLLDAAPELAGTIAMHHGSIAKELRNWVEDALYAGTIKAVVCTSSLDLGVDFRPVESIVQIGGPKGVSRFLQRAGRSGHQPGATSKIFFVPTHSLELLEAAALRTAIEHEFLEDREPYVRSFDVLIQFLVTLAVGGGFNAQKLYGIVKNTHCFESISDQEWIWCLRFITQGSQSIQAYDEFKKVSQNGDIFLVESKRVAYRHRLSMGTIVSDANLSVKFVSGGFIGTIEEWFVSKLKPGDVFWFAGRSLELVRIKEMMVQVKASKQKTGKVPSWMGGRMPLSSQLGEMLRIKLGEVTQEHLQKPIELKMLEPLFLEQSKRSIVPSRQQLLIEYITTKEGYHLFVYPFEGRFVHEGMAALIAWRIAQINPITFSLAFSDYGFELLSDQPIPIYQILEENIFSTLNLREHTQQAINAAEMARRKFRDIASISGLVFTGYPGKTKKDKHLQSSAQLFFDVFQSYEPDNLLLLQAYEEVHTFQLEEGRLLLALNRINQQEIVVKELEQPTPFAFPIMIDRLREKLSSEKLEDRVRRMTMVLEKS